MDNLLSAAAACVWLECVELASARYSTNDKMTITLQILSYAELCYFINSIISSTVTMTTKVNSNKSLCQSQQKI